MSLELGPSVITVTAVDSSFNQGSVSVTVNLGGQPSCPAEVIVDNLPAGQTSTQVNFTGTWGLSSQSEAFGANASLVGTGAGVP